MSIYLSTGAFESKQIDQILTFAVANQLDKVELSSGVAYSTNIVESVRSHAKSIDFLVHNYFPPPKIPFVLNLAAADQEIFDASLQMCRDAIDLTAEVGGAYYSVHAGFCFYLTPEMLGDPVTQATVNSDLYTPVDQAYEIFLGAVKELAQYASDQGVDLFIENNVVSPKYLAGKSENDGLLLAEPSEMVRFMGDIQASNVKILLDVAHLAVSATALNFDQRAGLELLAPHIGALHLSDNDGIVDNNQPIRPTSWFCDMLPGFANLTWVLEVYNLSLDSMTQQMTLLQSFKR